MIVCVRTKPGVQFQTIAPAGFRLLGAIERSGRQLGVDLTITCGTDSHPPTDPHAKGEAYDIRVHNLSQQQKLLLLHLIMEDLQTEDISDQIVEVSGGYATKWFFAWLEHPGEPAEHIHAQRRNGVSYPPVPKGSSLS